jgi:alpha-ketoglutarate-dependent taurine dioxygenase
MNIKPLNYCGIEITDVDIACLTDDEYNRIKDLYLEHLIIVFRNQKVATVPYAKLIQRLGTIANWRQAVWDIFGKPSKFFTGKAVDAFSFTGPDYMFPVQRVTGKKINGQRTGIFGQGKLDWHSNMNGPFNRARGVALQGVSKAIIGTSTSWMDTTLAYEAMSDELKKRCEGVIGRFEYSPEIWAEGLPPDQYEDMLKNKEEFYEMPLVNLTNSGRPGLYFHFMNKCSFPSDPELLEILKEHCFQPQFIYTHNWQQGDIVISDQVLTLHRRDQDDPAVLAERVLSRYTFNH